MATRDTLERSVIVVTLTCTVILTILSVSRQFGYGAPETGLVVAKPTKVPAWPRVVDGGHRLGRSTAKVTVVEFSDFECPACQYFARAVKPALAAEFGNDIAFVYRHYPLRYHRLARPYALASECAGEQGRFWQFHDEVFSRADSMGSKTLESFAHDAGVANIQQFVACLATTTAAERITRDVEEAKRIGITGTPMLVVNGIRLGALDSASVIGHIRHVFTGQ